MGKTFRKNDAIPISYSWNAPHNRSFAKRNKRKRQHSLRNKNRNIDEMTIGYCQDSPYILKWESNYLKESRVIPKIKLGYDYNDEIKTEYYDEIDKLKTEYYDEFYKISKEKFFCTSEAKNHKNEYYRNMNWDELNVTNEINFKNQYHKIDLKELDLFDSIKNRHLYYKKINWCNNKVEHKDFVEHIIENSVNDNQKKNMKIRKKQIDRRGKEGQFKGHR